MIPATGSAHQRPNQRSAASGDARELQSSDIDIVLLDLDLGQERDTDFLERLPDTRFDGKVLLVTADVNDNEIPSLIRKGISGVFMKHRSPAR